MVNFEMTSFKGDFGGTERTQQPGLKSDAAIAKDPVRIVKLYTKFQSKMNKNLLEYMEKFYDSSGGIDYHIEEHSELSVDLINVMNSNSGGNVDFGKNMVLYSKAINGIYASSIYYEECQNIIAQKDLALKQYTTPRQNFILSEEASLSEVATIRPEIVKYIQLHGVPNNLVFDSVKLGNILLTL